MKKPMDMEDYHKSILLIETHNKSVVNLISTVAIRENINTYEDIDISIYKNIKTAVVLLKPNIDGDEILGILRHINKSVEFEQVVVVHSWVAVSHAVKISDLIYLHIKENGEYLSTCDIVQEDKVVHKTVISSDNMEDIVSNIATYLCNTYKKKAVNLYVDCRNGELKEYVENELTVELINNMLNKYEQVQIVNTDEVLRRSTCIPNNFKKSALYAGSLVAASFDMLEEENIYRKDRWNVLRKKYN